MNKFKSVNGMIFLNTTRTGPQVAQFMFDAVSRYEAKVDLPSMLAQFKEYALIESQKYIGLYTPADVLNMTVDDMNQLLTANENPQQKDSKKPRNGARKEDVDLPMTREEFDKITQFSIRAGIYWRTDGENPTGYRHKELIPRADLWAEIQRSTQTTKSLKSYIARHTQLLCGCEKFHTVVNPSSVEFMITINSNYMIGRKLYIADELEVNQDWLLPVAVVDAPSEINTLGRRLVDSIVWNIFNDDLEKFRYFCRYVRKQISDQKSLWERITWLFEGVPGGGKNTFFERILGVITNNRVVKQTRKQMESEFNSGYDEALFILGDELKFGMKDSDELKSETGGIRSLTTINKKNQPTFRVENILTHIFITNNIGRSLKISADDRRIVVNRTRCDYFEKHPEIGMTAKQFNAACSSMGNTFTEFVASLIWHHFMADNHVGDFTGGGFYPSVDDFYEKFPRDKQYKDGLTAHTAYTPQTHLQSVLDGVLCDDDNILIGDKIKSAREIKLDYQLLVDPANRTVYIPPTLSIKLLIDSGYSAAFTNAATAFDDYAAIGTIRRVRRRSEGKQGRYLAVQVPVGKSEQMYDDIDEDSIIGSAVTPVSKSEQMSRQIAIRREQIKAQYELTPEIKPEPKIIEVSKPMSFDLSDALAEMMGREPPKKEDYPEIRQSHATDDGLFIRRPMTPSEQAVKAAEEFKKDNAGLVNYAANLNDNPAATQSQKDWVEDKLRAQAVEKAAQIEADAEADRRFMEEYEAFMASVMRNPKQKGEATDL